MEMEASITSPVCGTVQRLAIGAQQQVEGCELLIVVA
jgi:pyruvate carboxylase